MSAITSRGQTKRRAPVAGPRANDPRVVRSRAAVVDAARILFLKHGYAATTVEEIGALAGVTKRTVYNNFGDKEALFTQIIADTLVFAEAFAQGLHQEFATGITRTNVVAALNDLGIRLSLGIVRTEVVALRRLLIGESRDFPQHAADYFQRAPGQVIDALAAGFARLTKQGILATPNARRAAAQFAYLVAGEALDRAMLVGTVPPKDDIVAAAHDGVETFLARYLPRRKTRSTR